MANELDLVQALLDSQDKSLNNNPEEPKKSKYGFTSSGSNTDNTKSWRDVDVFNLKKENRPPFVANNNQDINQDVQGPNQNIQAPVPNVQPLKNDYWSNWSKEPIKPYRPYRDASITGDQILTLMPWDLNVGDKFTTATGITLDKGVYRDDLRKKDTLFTPLQGGIPLNTLLFNRKPGTDLTKKDNLYASANSKFQPPTEGTPALKILYDTFGLRPNQIGQIPLMVTRAKTDEDKAKLNKLYDEALNEWAGEFGSDLIPQGVDGRELKNRSDRAYAKTLADAFENSPILNPVGTWGKGVGENLKGLAENLPKIFSKPLEGALGTAVNLVGLGISLTPQGAAYMGAFNTAGGLEKQVQPGEKPSVIQNLIQRPVTTIGAPFGAIIKPMLEKQFGKSKTLDYIANLGDLAIPILLHIGFSKTKGYFKSDSNVPETAPTVDFETFHKTVGDLKETLAQDFADGKIDLETFNKQFHDIDNSVKTFPERMDTREIDLIKQKEKLDKQDSKEKISEEEYKETKSKIDLELEQIKANREVLARNKDISEVKLPKIDTEKIANILGDEDVLNEKGYVDANKLAEKLANEINLEDNSTKVTDKVTEETPVKNDKLPLNSEEVKTEPNKVNNILNTEKLTKEEVRKSLLDDKEDPLPIQENIVTKAEVQKKLDKVDTEISKAKIEYDKNGERLKYLQDNGLTESEFYKETERQAKVLEEKNTKLAEERKVVTNELKSAVDTPKEKQLHTLRNEFLNEKDADKKKALKEQVNKLYTEVKAEKENAELQKNQKFNDTKKSIVDLEILRSKREKLSTELKSTKNKKTDEARQTRATTRKAIQNIDKEIKVIDKKISGSDPNIVSKVKTQLQEARDKASKLKEETNKKLAEEEAKKKIKTPEKLNEEQTTRKGYIKVIEPARKIFEGKYRKLESMDTQELKNLHDIAKSKDVKQLSIFSPSEQRAIADNLGWNESTKVGNNGKVKYVQGEAKPRIISESAYEQAHKNLVEKTLGRNSAMVDPTIFKDLITVGAYHFENGLRKFSEWSAKMVGEYGEGIKRQLKKVWANMDKNIPRMEGEDVSKYGMSHRPSETGAIASDVTLNGEMLPKDFYTNPSHYAHMQDITYRQSFSVLQRIKDNPNADVTIYRASPSNSLNVGDWVTLSREYAKGESLSEGTKVHQFKVKAKDIQFAGDDINEFGFYPENGKPITPAIEDAIIDLRKETSYILKYGKIPPNGDLGGFRKSPEYGKYGSSERQQTSAYYDYIEDKVNGLKTVMEEQRTVSEEAYTQAKKNIIAKGQNLSSGIDPTILKDYATIGAYHLENGVVKFADWSKRMIEQIGEHVRPYLRALWDEVNKNQKKFQIPDEVKNNPLSKKDFLEIGNKPLTESDYRQWTKEYSKNKTVLGHFRQGIESTLNAVKNGKNLLSYMLKPIDSIIEGVDRGIYKRLIEHEMNTNKLVIQREKPLESFLLKIKDMDIEDRAQLTLAMMNGDGDKLNFLFDKYGMQKEHSQLRTVLDEIAKGSDLPTSDFYFPRKIKDYSAFLKEVKGVETNVFDELIQDYIKKYGDISDEQKAQIIDNTLRGYGDKISLHKLGNEKERLIRVVNANLAKFYYDPIQSLGRYIKDMTEMQEARKLFGKGENLQDSIGAYINDMIAKKQLDLEQANKIKDALVARFNEKTTDPFVSRLKNLNYAEKLSQVTSPIVQFKDLAKALYRSGARDTAKAIYEILSGKKKVSLEDIGVDIKEMARELSDPGKLNTVVKTLLKANGFRLIDGFGKTTFINGYLKRYQRLAQRGSKELDSRLNKVFEPLEAKQVTLELKEGKLTDNVKLLLFSELSRTQPITKSAMPMGYTNSPKARLLYTFKTFSIREFDFLTNETWREYRAGNKAKALKNALKLSLFVSVLGGTVDTINDAIMGRKIDVKQNMLDNLMGLAGLTRYQLTKSQSAGELLQRILLSLPVPFLDNAYQSIKRGTPAPMVRSFPVVGNLIYNNWLKPQPKTGKPKVKTQRAL